MWVYKFIPDCRQEDSLKELSLTLFFHWHFFKFLAWLLGSLREHPTLAAHGKHQRTDALQFVTGEQPVYSTHTLQSIWEVGGTGSPQRGGSPGNPSGYHGYWCFIFSRWHYVYWEKQKKTLDEKSNCFLRKYTACENAWYFVLLSNVITQILFSIHVSTLIGAQGILWFIILAQMQGCSREPRAILWGI